MKIAMIGHKRIPSREGGIEVVVEEIAVRLAARGHQVDCYNRFEPSVQKHMPRVKAYRGLRLFRVRTFKRNSLNAAWYSMSAAVRALFKGYDVVHFHAEGPAAMAFLTRLFRIPTAVTIHGLDWQRAKWGGFATKYLRFGEKMAAKYADALIVLTKDDQQYFYQTYGRTALLISNGISPRPCLAPDEMTRRFGLEKDGYILFLARLVPEKGLDYLIEAYQKVETDKRLVIAGKIDQSEYTAAVCVKAKADARILMTDFVTGGLLNELLSNCALYVLPSDLEGMSISLLEALASGRRCLISDIPQNRETAGEYATYFEKSNAGDLALRLKEMLEQPDSKEEQARRAAYVAERYNWDTVTEKTLSAYETIAARPHESTRAATP